MSRRTVHLLEDDSYLAWQVAGTVGKGEVTVVIHSTWRSLYDTLQKTLEANKETFVVTNRVFPLSEWDTPGNNLLDVLDRLKWKFALWANQILVFSGNTMGLDQVVRQGIQVVSKADDDAIGKIDRWVQDRQNI